MISTARTIHSCRRPSSGGGKCVFYLLEFAIVNSYILRKEARLQVGAKPLTALDFRRSVIEDSVQDHLQGSGSRPSIGRPRLGPTPIRLNCKLRLLDPRSTYCNCVVCSGQMRHTTGYVCKTYPEKLALHPTACFEQYHTQANYCTGNYFCN